MFGSTSTCRREAMHASWVVLVVVRDHAVDVVWQVTVEADPVTAHVALGAHERAPDRLLAEFGVDVFHEVEGTTVSAHRAAVASSLACPQMMMMKFMFNVAAITWIMSDSRIWA